MIFGGLHWNLDYVSRNALNDSDLHDIYNNVGKNAIKIYPNGNASAILFVIDKKYLSSLPSHKRMYGCLDV